MSDHYMTFTILDLKIPKSNCKSIIVKCRNYNKFDEYLFQQDILNSFVFNTLYNIVDLNEAWARVHQGVVKETSVVNAGGLGRI